MKGCTDAYEPECIGSWCPEWGFCEFSLSAMFSSEREEWIKELKRQRQGKKLPKGLRPHGENF